MLTPLAGIMVIKTGGHRIDRIGGLLELVCEVWCLLAAFAAANSHSSEGALDSAGFCDCLVCFRSALLNLRRKKAHFGRGSVSLRRGCEQVMFGSLVTLGSREGEDT